MAGDGETKGPLDLAAVHRFHEVGGDAAADGPFEVLGLVVGGDGHDGDRPGLGDGAGGFEAVKAGHDDVHDDGVGSGPGCLLDRPAPVADPGHDVVTEGGEFGFEPEGDDGVVLSDEHPHGFPPPRWENGSPPGNVRRPARWSSHP